MLYLSWLSDQFGRRPVLLAGLVLVRTFLSWTLVLEIEGRWPWQRNKAPKA